MNSSLRERLARLGPIRAIDRVTSGSPVGLSLAPGRDLASVKTVSAAMALARRGVSMLRAKRAMEEMIEQGRAWILLPTVESKPAIVKDLDAAGVAATVVIPLTGPDVAQIRERLHLTQEQFALRFGFDLRTLQNWEAGRRSPDQATSSYLKVIETIPAEVEAALLSRTG